MAVFGCKYLIKAHQDIVMIFVVIADWLAVLARTPLEIPELIYMEFTSLFFKRQLLTGHISIRFFVVKAIVG